MFDPIPANTATIHKMIAFLSEFTYNKYQFPTKGQLDFINTLPDDIKTLLDNIQLSNKHGVTLAAMFAVIQDLENFHRNTVPNKFTTDKKASLNGFFESALCILNNGMTNILAEFKRLQFTPTDHFSVIVELLTTVEKTLYSIDYNDTLDGLLVNLRDRNSKELFIDNSVGVLYLSKMIKYFPEFTVFVNWDFPLLYELDKSRGSFYSPTIYVVQPHDHNANPYIFPTTLNCSVLGRDTLTTVKKVRSSKSLSVSEGTTTFNVIVPTHVSERTHCFTLDKTFKDFTVNVTNVLFKPYISIRRELIEMLRDGSILQSENL